MQTVAKRFYDLLGDITSPVQAVKDEYAKLAKLMVYSEKIMTFDEAMRLTDGCIEELVEPVH